MYLAGRRYKCDGPHCIAAIGHVNSHHYFAVNTTGRKIPSWNSKRGLRHYPNARERRRPARFRCGLGPDASRETEIVSG